MKRALLLITIGFAVQLLGVALDLTDHIFRVFPQGAEAFFAAPAHDVVGIGLIVTFVGIVMAWRKL